MCVNDSVEMIRAAISKASTDAEAAAAAASTTADEHVSIPHGFCLAIKKLLTALAATFPENEALCGEGGSGGWAETFNTTILGIPEMEEWAIKKWDYDMTYDSSGHLRDVSLYESVKKRDIEALLSADLWVLDEIDARTMYNDPDLSDADREGICKHFDSINSFARMYVSVPEDLRTTISEVLGSTDPDEEVTEETAQHLLQRVVGCDPAELGNDPAALEKLVGWSTSIMDKFSQVGFDSIGSMMGENGAMCGTGQDLESLLGSLHSQLHSAQELLQTGTDSAVAAEEESVQRMLGGEDAARLG